MASAVLRSSQAVDANSSSRHSNNAGSPLPFIPRRRSSMPSSIPFFPFPPPDPVAPSTTNKPQNSSLRTPDNLSSHFESSKSHPSGKARVQLKPLLPLQPASTSTLEFPRHSPSLTASRSTQIFPLSPIIPPLALNDPAQTTDTAVTLSPSPSVDGNIRKKSGEPLKSSLKSIQRPSLAIKPPSKSEPGTPTHVRSKSVSFAERIDHVKLFFPEQKPIAVSRDGSPTEDTSGTESEPPVSIRRTSSDEKKRLLVMEVVNMPQRWAMDVDVMLEDVTLSKEATICGHVKVRNIAFEKSVVVRFTFDFWQTTSEVTARYEQSLAHGAFDRFSFVIRLHDILAKIEDKTLFMAIRYVVNRQELWDNNFGQDYKFTFTLPVAPRPRGTLAQIQYISDEEAVADLTQKLERVQPMEKLKNIQRLHRRQGSPNAEHHFFNSTVPLSSRYAWKASLKEPFKPADRSTPSHPKRTSQLSSSRVLPWSQEHSHSSLEDRNHGSIRSQVPNFTRGSPRFGDDDVTSAITAQDPPPGGSLEDSSPVRPSFRKHKRGSFDIRPPNGLADTGSLGAKTAEAVFDLVPPRDKASGMFQMPGGIERMSSDDSTTSSSSSSQPSPVVFPATNSDPPSKQMASILSR